MKSYHFDLGNSDTGPIGFCATVKANSEPEALEALKAALEWNGNEIEVSAANGDNRIDYIEVYFNPDAITTANIDMVEECDNEYLHDKSGLV